MELEGSLPHSQQPATCSYPESDRSSPRPHPTSQITILILSSIYAWVFQVVFVFLYIFYTRRLLVRAETCSK